MSGKEREYIDNAELMHEKKKKLNNSLVFKIGIKWAKPVNLNENFPKNANWVQKGKNTKIQKQKLIRNFTIGWLMLKIPTQCT